MIETQLALVEKRFAMFCTFSEIAREASVNDKGVLRIHGKEIGLVYFRTGYQSDHYQTNGQEDPKKWGARELLETSMAIKCPSVDV